MRINANLFWILAAFFFVSAVGYTVWSVIDHYATADDAQYQQSPVEWVGTVGITLAAVLSFFIAFYVTITQKAIGARLPEDRFDAEIDDGDPEVGHFSPWSWWPMTLGLALALIFLGFAVGIWITFIGFPILLIAVIGWNYEYYRGNFAR